MCVKKKYFTINFIRLIHKACHILSNITKQCQYLIFTVSAFIFLTLTPSIPILLTTIPQHIIIGLIHPVDI